MRHNIFLRLLLLGFLFFPTIAQQLHLLAAHDHPICDESELHIHQIDTTCELLDYVFSPQAVEGATSFVYHELSYTTHSFYFVAHRYATSLFSTQLRGPPVTA